MTTKQDNFNANEAQILIDDLQVTNDQADEVKGGPVFVGGWGASTYQYAF